MPEMNHGGCGMLWNLRATLILRQMRQWDGLSFLCSIAILKVMQSITEIFPGAVNTPWQTCFFSTYSFVRGCIYNPQNPTVYFDLGGALAAVGLLFAAYQLSDKKWKIRHRILWKYSEMILWGMCVVGLICALFASIFPSLGIISAPKWSYPILWEVLAYVCFLSGLIYYVVVGLFRKSFLVKSMQKDFILCFFLSFQILTQK